MSEQKVCKNGYQTEEYYDFIVENYLTQEALEPLYPEGCVEVYSGKYAFLHVPRERVTSMEQYGYSAIPKLYGLMDTSSIEETGAFRVQNQPALALRGQGVIIGFIDTGIAYDLDLFRYEDGTSRILGLWDQNITNEKASHNDKSADNATSNGNTDEVPFPFAYGTAWNQEQINQALREENPYEMIPSKDEEGHGTFLAGIAAGRRDVENDFVGMAPDASLAVVKLRQAKQYLKEYNFLDDKVNAYSEIDLLNAVKYLLILSRYYHKPLIICLGLGTNQGGHDGKMPLSQYLSDIAASSWVAVVQAAGNEGNARRHYQGETGPNFVDTIEIKVGARTRGFVMEIWASELSNLYIGLQSPSGDRVEPTIYRTNEVRKYPFLLDGSTVYVYDRLAKMQESDYLVMLRFDAPSEGIWSVLVANQSSFRTGYHSWMPIQQFLNEETYFLSSSPYTTLVSNACATNTIVAGMYNHLQNSVTSQSSKGYTRINEVKPDLLAPGVDIFGPSPNGRYTRKTGSSIAAAHTAGAAAMVMEYAAVRGNYTYIDGADIRAVMIRSAKRNPGVTYPNETYGYGFLDIYQLFLDLRW